MTKWVTVGRETQYKHPWKHAKFTAYFNEGRRTCEMCGIKPATEAHHGIVKRDKNCKAVDHLFNVVMVDKDCHEKADGWENTQKNIENAVQRYGVTVLEWLNELKELGKEVDEQLRYAKGLM